MPVTRGRLNLYFKRLIGSSWRPCLSGWHETLSCLEMVTLPWGSWVGGAKVTSSCRRERETQLVQDGWMFQAQVFSCARSLAEVV